MKFFAVLLLVSTLAVAAYAATSHQVLFNRQTVPEGWSKSISAGGAASVEFTLALKQRNLDILEKWVLEVSNPDHEKYQEFMSIDQILDLVAPTEKDHNKVLHWLHSHGVHHNNIKSYGDAIDVKTTVAVASRLFKTAFFQFNHIETGAQLVRQYGTYSIPSDLSHLIEMVTGLSTFPIPHLTIKRASASNDYSVVPQTLAALYNLPAPAMHPNTRARLAAHKRLVSKMDGVTSTGVIEFQGQNYSPTDLAAFGTQTNLPVPVVTANDTVGPNDPTQPQTEAQLDIEMIASVNTVSTPWFWLEQGNGWLYQFATHFFSTEAVPQVNSVSYGWWEGDQCTIDQAECSSLGVDSYGYVDRVNAEFQKIALRGISLLVASGDSGANGRTDPTCTIPRLRPSFPGASPWVTTVGATQLNNAVFNLKNPPPICASSGMQCPSGGTEVAVSFDVSSFTSGGGFSDRAPTPDWQKDAVQGYFNSGVKLPPATYYNATSRGFPDVAAIGHNTLIIQGGQIEPVGGTSAATPIFAGVIGLLNEAVIAKTGKPLGFLNPFLYKMAAAEPTTFQDITSGDNICTEQGCGTGCQGFYAYKGWDPVTGLGSPNYEAMLKYVQANMKSKKN